MADCLLLLGGNMGDRLAKLRFGVKELARVGIVLKKTRVYETAPVGPSSRSYLNAIVKLRTDLSPMGLLVECKRIEAAAGRRPAARWTKRPLDIDILDYGGLRLKNAWLRLPHPRMLSRPFVRAPLAEITLLPKLIVPASIVKIYPHGL